MVLNLGNGQYKFFMTDSDLIDYISHVISPEFANEIQHKFDSVQEEIDRYIEENEIKWYEVAVEERGAALDDINSLAQHLLVELRKGKQMNREKIMKVLEQIIHIADSN